MVRPQAAGRGGRGRRRRAGRGHRVVPVARQRGTRADGRARRQPVLRVRAVRGRRGGRPSGGCGGRPAAALRHDVGRNRAAERRVVQRHRMVRPTGVHDAVSVSLTSSFSFYFFLFPSYHQRPSSLFRVEPWRFHSADRFDRVCEMGDSSVIRESCLQK